MADKGLPSDDSVCSEDVTNKDKGLPSDDSVCSEDVTNKDKGLPSEDSIRSEDTTNKGSSAQLAVPNAVNHGQANLIAFEDKIQSIVEVGHARWDRETIFRALVAANQSADVAIHILSSGIFEQIDIFEPTDITESSCTQESPNKRRGWRLLDGPQVALPSVPQEHTPPRDFSNKKKGRLVASPWDPPEQKPAKATVPAAVALIPAADPDEELAEYLAKDEEAVHAKLKAVRASEEKTPELRKVTRSLGFIDKVKRSGGL